MKVVIGTYDGGLMGWESNFEADPTGHTLQLTYAFGAHDGSVRALALHDTAGGSGSTLVSGGIDETIRVFNLRRHKEVGSLLEHKAAVTALEFFRGGHLLSGDQTGSVCVWRTSDWLCLDHMRGHKGAVNSISIHPTGRLALSVAGDRSLIMWDLTKGKAAFSTRLPGPAQRVAWACGGKYFLVVFDASMAIHDGATGALIRKCGDSDSAASLGTGISGVVKICDVTVVAAPPAVAPAAAGSKAKAGKAAKGGAGAADSAAPDASAAGTDAAATALVVCGHEGGDVAVWEIPSGRLIRRFATGHARRVRAVAYCDGVTPAEVAAAATRAASAGSSSAAAAASAAADALSDDLNPLSRLAAASKLQTALPAGCGPLLATSDSEGTVKLWRASEALAPAASAADASATSSSGAGSSAEAAALTPVATLTAAAGSRITCLTASRRAVNAAGGAGGDEDDGADAGIGSGSAAVAAAGGAGKGKGRASDADAAAAVGGKRKNPDAAHPHGKHSSAGAGAGKGDKHAAKRARAGDALAAADASASGAGAGAGGGVKVSFASKKARHTASPAAAATSAASAPASVAPAAAGVAKPKPKAKGVRFSA